MTEEFANDHGFLRGPGSVRVAGFLIAAGPLLPIGLAAAIPTADPPDAPLGQFAAAIVAGIVVTLGGFVLPFRPKWGRTYATAGLLLWSALLIPGIGRSPALALGATVAMTFTLFSMWRGNAVVLPRTAEGGGMASVLAALTKSAAPAALAFWAFFR
ncbi:MAG: hypothetical protein M5R36_01790 [Deltaproteobacteria bacterium]|nr:hypothetical protein [Deltaproteobacteria bacterium]